MNETANNEKALVESEKPVQSIDSVKLPPFPDPSDEDFEDGISEEEKNFYINKFTDLNSIRNQKLHCTACDRHLGCSARNETKMKVHPMLRTLVCQTCLTFYNSGEFEKGDDGSELYCRWCGQGGQVYCCSDCPHVFCARCIRRNFGAPKIKEIENADDWKCFKCNPNCLWGLRAICWALLRYCDLKNKLVSTTDDSVLKEVYQNHCTQDHSTCCKQKYNRKEKDVTRKKEETKKPTPSPANIIAKIPSTIQVKKFASINLEESPKVEKKVHKRPASPKHKPAIIKNPVAIPLYSKGKMTTNAPVPPVNPVPPLKKLKLQPVVSSYTRIRPKGQAMPQMPIPIISSPFNGFHSNMFNSNMNNIVQNDNINLSLESLTQGLDMASMTAIRNNNDNDVVCTPDFVMEPLCEVTEENDDDVQCITPGPVTTPKTPVIPPPLVARAGSIIPEINSENIIQMTENDVTVNAATGGLKFRVDPQTLSSNKMYRLPDGRIFAINSNPNMPGGYSATIVALTESNNQAPPRGATYSAKLSAVTAQNAKKSPSLPQEINRNIRKSRKSMPSVASNPGRFSKSAEDARECDLNVPVEWYRYNLIDAVDALEYSLVRLNKLKKDTSSLFLRTRSVNEMRSLHRTLERLLNTSACRFIEIKENLNKGLKQYIMKKMGDVATDDDEEDDDVEILPNMVENDDPIFIDENSIDSNANDSHEVDLTVASSDHNESGENRDEALKVEEDPLGMVGEGHGITDMSHENMLSEEPDIGNLHDIMSKTELKQKKTEDEHKQEISKADKGINKRSETEQNENEMVTRKPDLSYENEQESSPGSNHVTFSEKKTKEVEVEKDKSKEKKDKEAANSDKKSDNSPQVNDDELQDAEMSETMIETILKDKGGGEAELTNLDCLEELQDT